MQMFGVARTRLADVQVVRYTLTVEMRRNPTQSVGSAPAICMYGIPYVGPIDSLGSNLSIRHTVRVRGWAQGGAGGFVSAGGGGAAAASRWRWWRGRLWRAGGGGGGGEGKGGWDSGGGLGGGGDEGGCYGCGAGGGGGGGGGGKGELAAASALKLVGCESSLVAFAVCVL